ncbi:hypothetical protein [Actinomadura alba]|uniref:Uncharacterized protein n=1 Tax=Actinomadura alba TaxID=406431 RepID=A0ABR7LS40_9ACTN|nr:hypothetical protein [Actinomadura alba]MBC6467589.1 hypothetical protein [Actinomadura alba]
MVNSDAALPLAGLDRVDWNRLLDGCGDVHEVPLLLVGLWGHDDLSYQRYHGHWGTRSLDELEERCRPASGPPRRCTSR